MKNENMPFDALIVGGSYAGLAAGLQLARARRKIAVLDAGVRRNRFSRASHGFLGQDGRAPGDIVADAKAQLLAYPTVSWNETIATSAQRTADGFSVIDQAGRTYDAKRLILATGIVDEMPDIPGFAERWGEHIFACPYCDGYELHNGRIGVIAVNETSFHQAFMLVDWGSVTLFVNGAMTLDETQTNALTARGVVIEHERIAAITGETPVVQLADGRGIPVDGLFTRCRNRLASPLADQLGCVVDRDPFTVSIRVTEAKETTVPGVYACGDAARLMHSVTLAVSDGAVAGISAHRSLIFG
jgi:thioredoxin reductase